MTAFLPWNGMIFWRKRHGLAVMLVNITLVVISISGLQLSGGGYCKTSGEWAQDATIVARSGNSWSDSYAPKPIMDDDNIRISFQLHDRNYAPADKFGGVPGYKCTDQAELPPSLSGRTILNFSATVATELKIAFIGDSITEQFTQAFDASVLGTGHERNRLAHTYRNGHGNINLHNCLSIAAPVRGGGVSAYWRVATLMSMSTRLPHYICEHRWNKWNEGQAFPLVDHRYSDDGKQLDNRHFHSPSKFHSPGELNITSEVNHPYSVGAFDAIVLRVPHGWLKIKEITKDRIVEAINLSNRYLGAQTIIISTLPFNNNVKSLSDWEGIARINQMIRDIARTWVQLQPDSIRHVLVQEFGNFTNQLLWMNAKHIHLNTSSPDFSKNGWELKGADFLLKRLSAATFWFPSISMVCAERTYPSVNEKNENVEDCVRNKISRDGAHWCVETLGPRYSASIACLLGCVYNGNEPSTSAQDIEMIRKCEQNCNDQFMSILPVEERWIGGDTTIFSQT
ncbi:hypothetical protein ACHAXR_010114 [Thalassiosira sp. AJA248-18]